MAARKKKKVPINLLPREKFAETTVGRILGWITSTFRIIVILTELVVLLAFLSRFWLDAQNADLNELIEQKQAVIATSSEFEREFRNIQKRLGVFSELASNKETASETLNSIVRNMPPDVLLASLLLSRENIQIEGLSPTERGIQQFIANLESSKSFQKVTLVEVKANQADQSLTMFKIKLTPKS
jgi:Tfp pilus assembly protein PilN